MTQIRQRPYLLADTGPFCRFAEGNSNQIHALAAYLGEAVHIVLDVWVELHRRAKTDQHAALNQLRWIDPNFPQHEPIPITDKHLLAQIDDIVAGRRQRKPGHFMEDRGEVATILLAKDRGWPILMDDGWGKRFAKAKNIETITTEDLCLEMATTHALSDEHAFEIFEKVYKTSRTQFDQRLAALGP
jgi:hypothetical protein